MKSALTKENIRKYLPVINANQVKLALGLIFIVIFVFLLGSTYGELNAERQYRSNNTKIKSVLGSTENMNEEFSMQRAQEIQQFVKGFIPTTYNVTELDFEESYIAESCTYILSMYPDSYSEEDQEFLSSASVIYCVDIKQVVLAGQNDEVWYDNSLGRWIYGDLDYDWGEYKNHTLREFWYGENLIPVVDLGGSHATFWYFIMRLDGSDELVILQIPISNRIRCDWHENDDEFTHEDCINYMKNIGIEEGDDWVPEEVIWENYKDLDDLLSADFGTL